MNSFRVIGGGEWSSLRNKLVEIATEALVRNCADVFSRNVYPFSKDGISLILKDLKFRKVEEVYMYDWSSLEQSRFFRAFKECDTGNIVDFLSVLKSYNTSLKLALEMQIPERPILSRAKVEALKKFFQVFLGVANEHRVESMREKRYNRVCVLDEMKKIIRELETVCSEGLKRIDSLAGED